MRSGPFCVASVRGADRGRLPTLSERIGQRNDLQLRLSASEWPRRCRNLRCLTGSSRSNSPRASRRVRQREKHAARQHGEVTGYCNSHSRPWPRPSTPLASDESLHRRQISNVARDLFSVHREIGCPPVWSSATTNTRDVSAAPHRPASSSANQDRPCWRARHVHRVRILQQHFAVEIHQPHAQRGRLGLGLVRNDISLERAVLDVRRNQMGA